MLIPLNPHVDLKYFMDGEPEALGSHQVVRGRPRACQHTPRLWGSYLLVQGEEVGLCVGKKARVRGHHGENASTCGVVREGGKVCSRKFSWSR